MKTKRITRRKAKRLMFKMLRYHGLSKLRTPAQRVFKREIFLQAHLYGATKIHFSPTNMSDFGTDRFFDAASAAMRSVREMK